MVIKSIFLKKLKAHLFINQIKEAEINETIKIFSNFHKR